MTNEIKKPWYKKWWAITIFIILGIIIISNMGKKQNTKTNNIIETQPQKAEIVFDLEKLYGKNINEIRTILGPPADGKLTNPTEQQIKLGVKQWDNTFKKGNYELLVTYNVSDKSVIDFFIPTDDSSGATKNTKNLEEVGNVVNTNKFTIEQVKTIRDPSMFTGIKITPKK